MKSLLFTYAMTYGGAVVSLFRPYIGFLIYVCFAVIKPDSLWEFSVPAGNYSRIVAVALLLGWGLHGFGKWNLGRSRGVMLALLGFWVVLVFCAAGTSDQQVAWAAVESMSKVFLPIFVGISLIDSWAKLRQLVWVIVLSQGFLAYEFNLTFYAGQFNPREFNHGGLDNNGVAITMVSSIGMAFFLGMHARRWWQKGGAFVLAMLMAHVVLFSASRGGMLALIITGAGCFLLTPRKPVHYLFLLVAVLLVVRLAGEGVQERFATTFKTAEEGSDQGGKRLEFWAAAWHSMQSRPLGVGPRQWPITANTLYGLPPMAAHSTWLQVGAELGFAGLFSLLAYYLWCMWRLLPFTREKRAVADDWSRYLARMVIASLVGFLVSAQFVSVEGIDLPYFVVLIGAGVLKLETAAERASATEETQETDAEPAGAGVEAG